MGDINIELSNPIRRRVVLLYWPVALIFFVVYIPISFFVLKDTLSGWMQISAFIAFGVSMIFYFKTKKVLIICNVLAVIGIPVLLPWIIDGGPANSGAWWSLAYVIWVFFITEKKWAYIWLSLYLFLVIILVLISYSGYITIAYEPFELFNLLFAFLITCVLVYFSNMIRDYYFQLSTKQLDELTKANTELLAANKEMEQFAFVASHDLKEPIRNISLFSSRLKERYAGKIDEDADRYLHLITNSTARMQQLINDLLEFSNLSKPHTFSPVDCNAIVKEVITDLYISIQETNAKIHFDPLPVVNGNDIKLKQLFQNLISNAIKFHKKDTAPEISISAERKNNEYIFAIKDNGIGIKKEYLEKIFVIFQRLNSVQEYTGTGIGLATCRKIVNLHYGKIWPESVYGEGTTFYFTLPAGE